MTEPAAPGLGADQALRLLVDGELTVAGRMAGASNATLYATISTGDLSGSCIYKPMRGERPLWDYPQYTLSRREVAAYAVSQATGWHIVPPTVWREGPYGPGSVQLWIETDPQSADLVQVQPAGPPRVGWHTILQAEDSLGRAVDLVHAEHPILAQMAVFDVLIDNADRKGGHILRSVDGRVWGVDHGLSFNVEPKLRTVLWGWQGQPLPAPHRAVVVDLAEQLTSDGTLAQALAEHLSAAEIDVTAHRIQELAERGHFPAPRGGGPAIPWPPF